MEEYGKCHVWRHKNTSTSISCLGVYFSLFLLSLLFSRIFMTSHMTLSLPPMNIDHLGNPNISIEILLDLAYSQLSDEIFLPNKIYISREMFRWMIYTMMIWCWNSSTIQISQILGIVSIKCVKKNRVSYIKKLEQGKKAVRAPRSC